MQTHIVLRAFEGPNGRVFQAGEAVDASKWAHTAKLVDQRRLRPITANDDAGTAKRGIQQAAHTAKER